MRSAVLINFLSPDVQIVLAGNSVKSVIASRPSYPSWPPLSHRRHQACDNDGDVRRTSKPTRYAMAGGSQPLPLLNRRYSPQREGNWQGYHAAQEGLTEQSTPLPLCQGSRKLLESSQRIAGPETGIEPKSAHMTAKSPPNFLTKLPTKLDTMSILSGFALSQPATRQLMRCGYPSLLLPLPGNSIRLSRHLSGGVPTTATGPETGGSGQTSHWSNSDRA